MNKFRHDLMLMIVEIVNIALMTAIFGACWIKYYALRVVDPFQFHGNCFVIAVFCVLFFLLANAYDAFEIKVHGTAETIYSQALSLLVTDGIMYCLFCLLARRFADPRPMLVMFVVHFLVAALWIIAEGKCYFATHAPKKSAVVYSDHGIVNQLIEQYKLQKEFSIQFETDAATCMKDLSVLDDVEVVFLNDVRSIDRNEILKYCVERDIEVYMTPRIGDTIMSSARSIHMFHLPMLLVERYRPSPLYLFAKRCFDIFASLVAITVFSPVLLVTAIAIKLNDGGPVFYTQERLTKNAKRFRIYKFRSMRVDAEKDGVARLSTGDQDDRITSVGRFIRKVRIDELPQLFNILKGDLSVVGPRPERPEIAAQYEKDMPEFRLRLQAKAGLTGYAQVYGKYNTRPYDKLKMDLIYISHPSVVEDLRICFATVKILFMPESTEGFAEEQHTVIEESVPVQMVSDGK